MAQFYFAVDKRKRNLAKIAAAFRELKMQAYVSVIAALCPNNPSRDHIKRLVATNPPPFPISPERVHSTLKLVQPQLWTDHRVRKHMSLGAEDEFLIDKCKQMLGTTQSGTVAVLVRAVLLASARGDVNLPELLVAARDMDMVQVRQLGAETSYDLSKS